MIMLVIFETFEAEKSVAQLAERTQSTATMIDGGRVFTVSEQMKAYTNEDNMAAGI